MDWLWYVLAAGITVSLIGLASLAAVTLLFKLISMLIPKDRRHG